MEPSNVSNQRGIEIDDGRVPTSNSSPKCSSPKSVRFYEQVQVFWIPSLALHQKQFSISSSSHRSTSHFPETNCSNLFHNPVKCVSFNRNVDVYEIPSRKEIKHLSCDLWYDYDDFGSIMMEGDESTG